MVLVLAILALLSLLLTLWQTAASIRFPLHHRISSPGPAPPVTLLKPLKGIEPDTAHCLKSWLDQEYAGQVQVLFGVASGEDPACELVRQLIGENPGRDLELVVCAERIGSNAKVSKLIQLEGRAKHELILVSDADVRVPPDFISQAVAHLSRAGVGLVHSFYALANPTTWAMQWEAVAINADFWTQVLQSRTLRRVDFALGAVMLLRRQHLETIGSFRALADYLADDFQLGNRIARLGLLLELCPVVVENFAPPMGWKDVWRHQLRWARTIRVCRPGPYFFSVLANATLWPVLWVMGEGNLWSWGVAGVALMIRSITAWLHHRRLTGRAPLAMLWMAWIKDCLQAVIWLIAFAGNQVQWRGEIYQVQPGGKMVRMNRSSEVD